MDILNITEEQEFILNDNIVTVYKFKNGVLLEAPNIKDRVKGYFVESYISFNNLRKASFKVI